MVNLICCYYRSFCLQLVTTSCGFVFNSSYCNIINYWDNLATISQNIVIMFFGYHTDLTFTSHHSDLVCPTPPSHVQLHTVNSTQSVILVSALHEDYTIHTHHSPSLSCLVPTSDVHPAVQSQLCVCNHWRCLLRLKVPREHVPR